MSHDRLSRVAAQTALMLLAILVLTSCAESPSAEKPPVAQAGGMGMSGGDGSPGAMVAGFVAVQREASLSVGERAVSSKGITVDRVVSPADGWVVVRSSIPPGAVLGKTLVRSGENNRVLVRLEAAETIPARIELHIDRGVRGVFEYDPEREGRNPDAPVIVDRQAVGATLNLSSFGANVEANSVLLLVEDQRLTGPELLVAYFITPGPSWISVNEISEGLPGRRLGLLKTGAGELQEIRVPLEKLPRGDQLVVTVHTDRGNLGTFDYLVSDPLGSTDEPYRSAGVIVSKRIAIR